MIYAKRDQAGRISAVSRQEQGEGWQALAPDHPEVVAFAGTLAGGRGSLATTDLGLARVVEDLIDLLIARDLIRFTDFPEAAQAKLMERRSLRSSLNSLNLLAEGKEEELL
jgi:hypothetical protein